MGLALLGAATVMVGATEARADRVGNTSVAANAELVLGPAQAITSPLPDSSDRFNRWALGLEQHGATAFTEATIDLTALYGPVITLPPPATTIAPDTSVTISATTIEAPETTVSTVPSATTTLAPATLAPTTTTTTTSTTTTVPVTEPTIDLGPRVKGDVETAAAALAGIDFDWQTQLPGWEIHFISSTPGYFGGTWPEQKLIEIYVREGQTLEHVQHVLAHELGHAVDVDLLSDAERDRWLELRNLPADTAWWGESGASDFAIPSGDFAEAFATWQTGTAHYASTVAAPASPEALGELAHWATR